MPKVTLEVIIERIENLTSEVRSGFDGVHARQDKTNGKVKKNSEWRLKNENPIKRMQGMMYSVIAFVFLSVGVGVLNLVIK